MRSNPNPFLGANFISKIFFWWLDDIILYGKNHDFETKNLYDTLPEDLSERLTYKLQSNWDSEVIEAKKQKKKPSLWMVLIKTYWLNFVKFSVFSVCYATAQLVHPLLLYRVLFYFQTKSDTNSDTDILWAYFNATVFIALVALRAVFIFHSHFIMNRLGVRVRVACSSVIYRKMIRLSSSARQKMNSTVISLLSVHASKFEILFTYAPFVIIIPIQLFIVSYVMSRHIGFIPTFVGVALLILQTFPVQAIYTKMTLKLRKKQVSQTDYRISLISEIINGIQAVKMYVWEESLKKLVFSARSREIGYYLKMSYLSSIVMSFSTISYRLSSLAITIVCVLQKRNMPVNKIFLVTQYMFVMRTGLSVSFFIGLKSLVDMCVSVKRIQDFLLLEEVKQCIEYADTCKTKFISIEHVTAVWDEKSIVFHDICLDFTEKNLCAIVGSVGSGKTSLLKLILGELKTASGQVCVNGKVSYASQEPWLFNGSVKDNILFGEVFDEGRYEQVINACALVADLDLLPYRDQTLVGERGSNLSGGQRARVNLARAVYREADIYLLDDPLSAVDAIVAKNIMKDCINGLLQDKTRILVTHSIQYIDGNSEVILLEHGKISFREHIKIFCQSNEHINKLTTEEPKESDGIPDKLETGCTSIKCSNIDKRNESKETEELIAKGAMESSIFSSYFKAGSWKLGFWVILTNVLFVVAVSTFDFGIVAWNKQENITMKNSTDDEMFTSSADILDRQSPYTENFVLVFGTLMSLVIFISVVKHICLSKFALNASKNIHNDIFSRLMITKMSFFNSNSTGKILNRFSEDAGVLDDALPYTLTMSVNPMFHLVAFLCSIVIANWWVLIPFGIVALITTSISKSYVRTVQKMKRLAASGKSPILSFAASSSEGAITVRASRAEHIVIKEFNARQDRQTAAQFLTVALTQAFSLRIELISVGFLALITYLFVIFKDDNTHEGYVGLTLMQIVIITEIVTYLVTKVTEVLAHMTSVERILQFKELEQETLIEDELASILPNSWPTKGEIIFEHLYLRYSHDDNPVLWDINCCIESGSKIGIVGRTGAGKSSLISALFRFAEIDGSILIDGINTKKVDLYELRSKLSVIPQEPLLFKASLRKNLDPLDKFDDATVYSALESVELKKSFNSLDFQIERGGSNLSIGQRQLLCLARAIITKTKILILDEATANVDSATDAIVQKTIRNEFKECTVLTIAHRLNTVMDCDKIMVMDSGRLIEFNQPSVLLQNKESYFFKMVEQSGMTIAKQVHDNSYTNI